MNTQYNEIIENYPNTITLDQFYRICHISKRKAKWLLENGIVPCQDSGKKTRRFKIQTISEKTARRAIKDLEKAGLVRKEYAYRENGSFTSNRYYLL